MTDMHCCWVSKEAVACAAKNTKRKRRSSPNESKDLLLVVSEEAASGSGGSAPGTSLETNGEDAATDDEVSGAPRSAVLQACTLTSGLLLAGGLLLREVNNCSVLCNSLQFLRRL
jgi:uncharacterized protein